MFFLVVGLAVVWWGVLLSLVVFTANPVLVNRDQVLRADCVISAVVSPTDPLSVSVTKEWKRGQVFQTVTIEGLPQSHPEPEKQYLIPISKVGPDTYTVTPTRLPDQPRLIYPADPEALHQLEEILSESVAGQSSLSTGIHPTKGGGTAGATASK